ncbi:MAG: glycosyltransferase [Candidatus Kerfeldbacteria bacterium]
MKIAYHYPNPDSIYAYRAIYHGFKNAFTDLGHEFHTFTANDSLADFLNQHRPDIFLTATHYYHKKFLDFELMKKYRNAGMRVCVRIDFWDSPLHRNRINEAKSLKDDRDTVALIKNGSYGDVFYHVVEQGDRRMEGFEKETGYAYHTVPLAADAVTLHGFFKDEFASDISYIGTNLPQKKEFFNKYLFPLKVRYRTKIYGQDWNLFDKATGFIQKIGQYYNIPGVKSFKKPPLSLEDEGNIYRSSTISVNIHEDFQREYGGDCNERTFKIPLCGGFEITDDVACIRKYFKEGEEIVIAKNRDEWYDKIDYYLKNPDKRVDIIAKGMQRVQRDHTYHNRARQIIELCASAR